MLGMNWGLIGIVYLSLILLSIGYNQLIGWLEKHGYAEGYTVDLVIGGVAFTLAGIAVISVDAALITMGGFVCSGLPMIIGARWRFAQKRNHGQAGQIKEVTYGNHTPGLAE